MSIQYQQIARDASESDRELWERRKLADPEMLNNLLGFKIEREVMAAGIM
jgi:hypothetical protein